MLLQISKAMPSDGKTPKQDFTQGGDNRSHFFLSTKGEGEVMLTF
jgi:hypothetical protein